MCVFLCRGQMAWGLSGCTSRGRYSVGRQSFRRSKLLWKRSAVHLTVLTVSQLYEAQRHIFVHFARFDTREHWVRKLPDVNLVAWLREQSVLPPCRSVNCGSGWVLPGCGTQSWQRLTRRFNPTSPTLTSVKTRRPAPISRPSNTRLSETNSTCEYLRRQQDTWAVISELIIQLIKKSPKLLLFHLLLCFLITKSPWNLFAKHWQLFFQIHSLNLSVSHWLDLNVELFYSFFELTSLLFFFTPCRYDINSTDTVFDNATRGRIVSPNTDVL